MYGDSGQHPCSSLASVIQRSSEGTAAAAAECDGDGTILSIGTTTVARLSYEPSTNRRAHGAASEMRWDAMPCHATTTRVCAKAQAGSTVDADLWETCGKTSRWLWASSKKRALARYHGCPGFRSWMSNWHHHYCHGKLTSSVTASSQSIQPCVIYCDVYHHLNATPRALRHANIARLKPTDSS